MPLARKLALRYRYTHEPLEDLVQVASLGLLKALERFQPDRGHRFTAFAAPTILGELKRHFRDRGWAVHVPRDLQERALAVSRHTERLSGILGRSPTLTELAESMDCGIDEVIEGTQALRSYDTASLDAPVLSEEQDSITLGDTLPSRDDGFELVHARAQMAERWSSLSDLERKVVELRVVHDMTQREIGTRDRLLPDARLAVAPSLARAPRGHTGLTGGRFDPRAGARLGLDDKPGDLRRPHMATPLQALTDHGQSPWLDYVSRPFTRGGDLARVVERGIVGVTSNPTIFQSAIADGDAYDDQLREVLREQDDPKEVFLALARTDIQEACDAAERRCSSAGSRPATAGSRWRSIRRSRSTPRRRSRRPSG